jgi:hypothetical protein
MVCTSTFENVTLIVRREPPTKTTLLWLEENPPMPIGFSFATIYDDVGKGSISVAGKELPVWTG